MAHPKTTSRRRRHASSPCPRAFTLLDVIVTIAVIGVLVAILLPALSTARDLSTRIVCASNIRQLGLGVVMYADDNRERMPATVYVSPTNNDQDLHRETVIVRLSNESPRFAVAQSAAAPHRPTGNTTGSQTVQRREPVVWDGIGRLFDLDYTAAPSVYYCPSHNGEITQDAFKDNWLGADNGEIVSNFQYRGVGPNGTDGLYDVEPRQASILADGFRSADEINHELGTNVLRADLAVAWVNESPAHIAANAAAIAANNDDVVPTIWRILDGFVPTN